MIDYLTTPPYVYSDRIGATGICAGRRYTTNAATNDRRVKAVGTVSAVNIGSMFGNGWDNNIKSADLIPVLENGSQAKPQDGKITEWTQPDQQSLGAAIDKDVRDGINAGAIPGPRLLTSIHQITGRIPWNQSSGESRARANQGAGGGGRSALATMGSVTDSGGRLAGFRERRFIGAIVQAWL